MSEWFPRPRSVRDLVWLGPSAELDVEQLFELLRSPLASEWRDKVGVIPSSDGSAKSTTRLLCADGWVFKTDTTAVGDRPTVERSVAKLFSLAARVELWHPDKRWFLLRTEDPEGWWPISVCPRLTTLRAVDGWDEFAPLWARALGFGLERSRLDQVGLDLGPSNFAFEPVSHAEGLAGALYYIDDETYSALEFCDLAEAIVGRIPEWPHNDIERWREFGLLLRGLLEPVVTRPSEWNRLREALAEVLLAPRWASARAALIEGIERRPPASSPVQLHTVKPTSKEPRRTALISDVHANLPALEVVLAAAEAEGVDSWLFLGDAVGYGPHPHECVARLASLPALTGVRGNHDHMACFGVEPRANSMARASLAFARAQLGEHERQWLMALPTELLGHDWLAVHGAPIDPLRFNAYVYAMSYRRNLEHLAAGSRRVCVHGHTHVPMIYRLRDDDAAEVIPIPGDGFELSLREGKALLINPGSVGQPRDGDPRAAFAIWDREREHVRFRRVEYDVASTSKDIVAVGLPDDLGVRLELGR